MSAQEIVQVHHKGNVKGYEIGQIDSILVTQIEEDCHFQFYMKDMVLAPIPLDSMTFAQQSDTVYISYTDERVTYNNPRARLTHIDIDHCNVRVSHSDSLSPLILSVSGYCEEGTLSIQSESDCHIVFQGLNLQSLMCPAIDIQSNVSTIIELAEYTYNRLTDSIVADYNVKYDGCIQTKGDLYLEGKGSLNLKGGLKHAIYSKKGITFLEGDVAIDFAAADAIHSKDYVRILNGNISIDSTMQDGIDADKGYIDIHGGNISVSVRNQNRKGLQSKSTFTMSGGMLDIYLYGDQSKGIKSEEDICITGGVLTGTAYGHAVIEDGDVSYCSLVKGDKNVCLSDVEVKLAHHGRGGRCISADGDLSISGGSYQFETTGDGNEYINAEDSIDYYTARCLGADQNILITKGTVSCISRGLGGKGMVSDHGMFLGEYEGANDSLTITIITEGNSVLNDVDEDIRNGCPKAFKSGKEFDVLSGNIYIKTYGMGGEGFECKDEMYIVGGNIILETYDDGINVGRSLNILNGNLFCCSENNDGIDSNGSIDIRGGCIVSISKHEKDESFDVEQDHLYFHGGTAIGIGRDAVNVADASIPFYTYPKFVGDWIQRPSEDINLYKDTYMSIVDGERIMYAVRIPDDMSKVYITVASNDFVADKTYSVAESHSIDDASRELFEGRLLFEGTSTDVIPLFPFNPKRR
ncbi:MAG: carbohydrate-binding domain-containing protein [Prevotella sp.]|nr:carbohydrate-binding domain-containing protein [Prevotella sp.]